MRSRPARQQPAWADPGRLAVAREQLRTRPALVEPADISALGRELARVAAGTAHVVQAGDCAEDPADCGAGDVMRRAALLDVLADRMERRTRRPVLRAGRIAGQFAKPRTQDTEAVGGQELPVYRGHLVNSPEPDPRSRRADARRLVHGHGAAATVLRHLGWPDGAAARAGAPVWTSHEALLLDYELPQLRHDVTGRLFLTSTHWPWIGERTRQLDGAHVALLAAVDNPVACKVGPRMTVPELLALCARLDPHRRPGRLTLIARLGAEQAAARLPELVRAVRDSGHPVIWLTDPMHGNTFVADSGTKTRFLSTVLREVRDFQAALRDNGVTAGGLHLETTPDDVTECVACPGQADLAGDKYTSLCDPRLNPGQALRVIDAWNA
ncbi:phospho-2-dehydro-3-deoxyheptonate aldolase [Actinoplanes utahensis]|uniref:Phospho-2-dehydro-3-deoxyheptonate aldolase n=1 Tax=Actinoplanes utahensis TaxID=1869 RepID=A0A0A6UP94_ACTUT|nr:phospho-2-dehydro-3-deoxyheptonate aldolase [Actinoplanes utahensis]